MVKDSTQYFLSYADVLVKSNGFIYANVNKHFLSELNILSINELRQINPRDDITRLINWYM